MTALQLLLRELIAHGSVTYATLTKKYPMWSREDFASAVYRARKRGLVTGGGRGKPIVKAGSCPCCGREL